MKVAEYALVLVMAVSLMIYATTANNCSSVKNFQWAMDRVYYHRVHYPGEWMVIRCSANVEENVTLWVKDRKLTVDNKKVKWASKNVFNITNLREEDRGIYKCKFCNEEKIIILSFSKGGKAWAKPVVRREPNQMFHDIGGSVNLTCSAGRLYDIEWYRLNPTESLKKKELTSQDDNGIIYKVLRLKNMYEQNVTYKCQIIRHPLNYRSNKFVNIQLKAPRAPKIEIQGEGHNFHPMAGEDFSMSYNVRSYPDSDIEWSRSRDGVKYVHIASCSQKGGCEKGEEDLKENITSTRFEIKNLEFPQDNGYYYKCNASNDYGKDSKVFQLHVYVKPEIEMKTDYKFEKGMIINCTLKTLQINPKEVNYVWFSCDSPSDTCDEDPLTVKSRSSSLQLDGQPKRNPKYLCKATNKAGSDNESITVFTTQQIISAQSPDQKNLLISMVLPIGGLCMIILAVFSVVLLKRRKLYGGFYLFAYPPLPDYMKKLDMNANIHDQVHKLPFLPEWEFPRERISLVRELGSGQFGVVWLAEAVGIAAFNPRDILRERAGGRRFSLFNRTAKRNSYVFCKQVTNVAVKKLKENFEESNLIDLKSELKILIHVGGNENIVNMLGACTKGKSSELCIIMEYCPNGNLREFLQNGRCRFDEANDSLISDLSEGFGKKNLIYLAWQIAKGMAFLISRKIIHRDLAARNVFLGNGFVAKVGDFGLARDVYKYEEYVKKSGGVLPVKWMALESIRDSIYNQKSDVWSFGVVMWELFTLGGTPYPGMNFNEVYDTLLSGKRMQPPVNCPDNIYNIMEMCWEENPESRPDFQNLCGILSEIPGCEKMTETFANNSEIVYDSSHEKSSLIEMEEINANQQLL